MPKRTDIKSILIIGAGPIVIGQACEFDYSGAQACKALREEGYRVILVNSNPATIMTDPEMADATYIEPIHWEVVRKIIEKERPDAILPTMGGQTALNCALDLEKHGVLAEFNVEMIGATADAIDKAEDRERFDKAMKSIGLECPRAEIAHSLDEAFDVSTRIGFPCIIRPSFTMGGSGGGIAYNVEEFEEICRRGLDLSPTSELLIDESLIGWKEYEMEVVRDKADNCIIVCTIENFDAMGVHTGDSITVAPAQTLTDKEFQIMRNAAMAVLREIGVETGGSNVQFGVDPQTGRLVIIEMNPRVSRSSALASKATGFPIAKVAAKLAIGYTLDELANDITGGLTPASFEPAIDYVVTKIPRFNFEKFAGANDRLTTQMKSVGEVMSIGRNQQESLQKALRGLEVGVNGLDSIIDYTDPENKAAIIRELREPGAERIWYVADAFRMGMDIEELFSLTNIDRWFLVQIEDLVKEEQNVAELSLSGIDATLMNRLKRKGFSDARIADLTGVDQGDVRELRRGFDIHPVYKRVDTCAAEFASSTAYMYSTYDEECEANPSDKDKIMVLGGGPNRIGQGIEFDYCCVHAALAMREDGYETIMVNCNPETVSTDYDTSDRLYFESVTLEDVLEIVRIEKPVGVIVQYGGQTPLKLARDLEAAGVPIIGTSPDAIDKAEDRERFQKMVNKLNLKQPANATVSNLEEALLAAEKIGFPLVVRPSYVLGGRAMEIVYDLKDLKRYLNNAVKVSNDSPVLLDRFLDDAIEVDVDAICDGKEVMIGGIMEHIEQAGVHSGDSACSLPPYSLSNDIQDVMREQVKAMALELGVVGLMNTQFAVKDGEVYLIEVNPRAARTVPFVSKATGLPIAKIGARAMAGQSLADQGLSKEVIPPFYSVKEVVLPFAKFQGVDPLLGPEMRSTGEVMGVGDTFEEAYAKANLGAGEPIPAGGKALLSVRLNDKNRIIELGRAMVAKGFDLEATRGTAAVLNKADVPCSIVNKLSEGRPNIVDSIKNGEYCYIINTTEGRQAIDDSVYIRREALLNKIPYTTTMNAAFATVNANKADDRARVNSVQELHKRLL
ncbi:carbamoyl-phosphate synthase large subunit [Paraglaciecola chathamensis]|uniref:Carbamoyl phosphate synthase large chain n=3 Tax=Paraglaciecola chathamensis TaxID=368405 RepID=A0A8H9LWH9_9ALTE|nr:MULTISPECIES: carbamoyl-phosphate synthase large subunit [Paraglaciecola]AEE22993.1 carbamoyl-phosphate synthase, large subunit [Glaciecola sp. 4H-3-7+YE-5]MBN24395.1 carbamoyl-phosphate synthase large subunit [Alteromonadaceae bacterium]GAC05332.1 carbamoyl-phosphate synthase large subunit [Paraglaciecola agarilytica NO2]GAC10279.1 carbamoyl-phosphate synthase large subunit [Paraglaciecola chathamensis S18K6]GGZ63189.1 carbamoyl-phosphate synthase (glutamine-hydrolyzing) [Paraglaciecola oc|tara:strand:- start:71174 stop:74392 length:3219 start_codon:yes stop_codon:yes gene_type:complete